MQKSSILCAVLAAALLCSCGSTGSMSEAQADSIISETASSSSDIDAAQEDSSFADLQAAYDASIAAIAEKTAELTGKIHSAEEYEQYKNEVADYYDFISDEQSRLYDATETAYRDFCEELLANKDSYTASEFYEAIMNKEFDLRKGPVTNYMSVMKNLSDILAVAGYAGNEAASEAEEKLGAFANAQTDLESRLDEINNEVHTKFQGEGTDTDASQSEPASDSENFRDTVDAYEACINEYIDFVKKYQNSTDQAAMMSDYAALMEKYQTFSEKFNSIDTSALDADDYAYYVEVMNRCNEKMQEAAQ